MHLNGQRVQTLLLSFYRLLSSNTYFSFDLLVDILVLQCAASMNVSVGSFSNPDGLEGLAHFLGKCFYLLDIQIYVVDAVA